MRIKITLCYDGTEFSGWQKQPRKRSVQETLETAIEKITGEKVKVTGSGRTDAGVHAAGQTAHFDTLSVIPPENFYKALNTVLPKDIKVLSSELAADDFDACRNAKKKTYKYSFYKGDIENPLLSRFSTRLPKNADVKKMKEFAEVFCGKHNFKAFCASGTGALTFEREVYSVKIEEDAVFVEVYVCGGGFLYKMVRMICGALVAAGQGKIDRQAVLKAFEDGEKIVGITTLSPEGLTLMKVEYPKNNRRKKEGE